MSDQSHESTPEKVQNISSSEDESDDSDEDRHSPAPIIATNSKPGVLLREEKPRTRSDHHEEDNNGRNRERTSAEIHSPKSKIVVEETPKPKSTETLPKKRPHTETSATGDQSLPPKASKQDSKTPSASATSASAPSTGDVQFLLLKRVAELEENQSPIDVFRQEQKIVAITVRRIQKDLGEIISLQNAKPEWITTALNIQNSINQLLAHTSANFSAMKKTTETAATLLHYLKNNEVDSENFRDLMSEMKKLGRRMDRVEQAQQSHGSSLDFIRQNIPATHMKSLSYPRSVLPSTEEIVWDSSWKNQQQQQEQVKTPLCLFCELDTHATSKCPAHTTVKARCLKAKSRNICTKCLRRYTPDENGAHQGCQAANKKCRQCVEDGLTEGLNHHHLFCTTAAIKALEASRRASQGKRHNGPQGRSRSEAAAKRQGGHNGQGSSNGHGDASQPGTSSQKQQFEYFSYE